MNRLLEPVTIPIPAEHKGDPQRVGLALKESPHAVELRQAHVVKYWDGKRDVSANLQDFVDGLAHVGSFDLTDAPVRMVAKADGTQARDPLDAILTGQVDASKTVEFLQSRLFEVKLMSDYGMPHGETLGKPIEGLVRIYSEYRDHFVEMMRKRNAQRGLSRQKWKQEMWTSSHLASETQAKHAEWEQGEGPYYDGFSAEQNLEDEKNLPEMKKMLTRLTAWVTPVP